MTEKQIANEILRLRQRIAELEKLEIERNQSEKVKRENIQLFETIFDNTHIIILIAYMDPRFNFIIVNKAYAEADNLDPSFFPGKNHFNLYPNAENEEIFKRVVETGEPYYVSNVPP
jgi:PAS domain-containing protein